MYLSQGQFVHLHLAKMRSCDCIFVISLLVKFTKILFDSNLNSFLRKHNVFFVHFVKLLHYSIYHLSIRLSIFINQF